ncbi:four-carbon acid sugar kinase family protein [Brooklawnia cerclae]|uniref:4-hydroxythreonine-4-phosphate dehydrogenase n=1 Tax=Brooklawnia cerclae TaxID=349934 RepID=A0ABX0SC88_9ACTN|nr:four-carbon acid sugar kinase family protein [Brooklawnia cerclae]NIH56000.1 4-hydroxythreonine-4-phosphate dehydrogenase [Brooklawnia cerclae]
MSVGHRDVVVIADDLSGACEAAAALGGLPVHVDAGMGGRAPSRAVSLGSRELPAGVHLARLRAELDRVDDEAIVFVKTDSILRGPLVPTLSLLVGTGRPVLYSPSLPEQGRRIVSGVLQVDGIPLHETGLWARERDKVPRSVDDLLAQVPHRIVDGPLRQDALVPGMVTVCELTDNERPEDAAAMAVERGAILVGASALCRALVPFRRPYQKPLVAVGGPPGVTVVVGSAALSARRQVSRLADDRRAGLYVLGFGDAEPPKRPVGTGIVVVTLDAGDPVAGRELDPRIGTTLLEQLCRWLGDDASDLVIIGGETAAAVLASLRVRRLDVIREIEPGAVLSVAGERLVVTRPGSFGGDASLVHLVDALDSARSSVAKGNNHV